MPATRTPVADRDDHPERVHRDPAAHQERLQDVALDLLDQDHPDQHQQRGPRPLVDQGHQDGDRAGDRRADHRHEGAEEDQDADGEATKGTPRTAGPAIMMPIASTSATTTVARTNWVSEIQATRPEESTRSRATRGARRTSHDQIRWPSARKK
jgi:hypothetical protein